MLYFVQPFLKIGILLVHLFKTHLFICWKNSTHTNRIFFNSIFVSLHRSVVNPRKHLVLNRQRETTHFAHLEKWQMPSSQIILTCRCTYVHIFDVTVIWVLL